MELNEYAVRLVGVFAFFFALVGGPIAYQTFDPFQQVRVGELCWACVVVDMPCPKLFHLRPSHAPHPAQSHFRLTTCECFPFLLQPLEWFLSGSTGSMVVVAILVLRIYLGWSYVGDRLLSAAVAYEETGW